MRAKLEGLKDDFRARLMRIWEAFVDEVDTIAEGMVAQLHKHDQACEKEEAEAQALQARLADLRAHVSAIQPAHHQQYQQHQQHQQEEGGAH